MTQTKTSALFSLAAILLMLAPPHLARGALITGINDLLNGHPVSVFADVNGNQLNAVGFQLSGSAVHDPGVHPRRFS
jgi:hypothetical protein